MRRSAIGVAVLVVAASTSLLAQDAERNPAANPFGCLDNARKIGEGLALDDLHRVIQKKAADLALREGYGLLGPDSACSCLFVAELMKRVGDYRAEAFYHKAIAADPIEPAYDLFAADYFRVYRGAGRPQFPAAEFHYGEARRKLCARRASAEWDGETRRRVNRALIALYQEDGLPLLTGVRPLLAPSVYRVTPNVLFSSINTYARATTDLPEIDDAREFTSEAMFSESSVRLNRSLTKDELRSYARPKNQFETLNRLRLRNGTLPVLDFAFTDQTIEDAQVTNFYMPGEFNDVHVSEYGVAISSPVNVAPWFDAFGRVGYKRIERVGVIEYLPDAREDIDQVEATIALSRFVGPDKLNVEFVVAQQEFLPNSLNQLIRNRTILGGTVVYQLFRKIGQGKGNLADPYARTFQPRGIEFFGGILADREAYGEIDVRRHDYFGGAAVRGFTVESVQDWITSFDFLVQATVFDSYVENDNLQDNAQYRTNVTLLARFLDEETQPSLPDHTRPLHPAFLHLLIPFKHDIATDGLKDFENFAIGVQLNAKFFTTRLQGTSFLCSAGYQYERFYRLDKDVHLYHINLSMGF